PIGGCAPEGSRLHRVPTDVRPEGGARCVSSARRDLCGGRGVILVPTATPPRSAQNPSGYWGAAAIVGALAPWVRDTQRLQLLFFKQCISRVPDKGHPHPAPS